MSYVGLFKLYADVTDVRDTVGELKLELNLQPERMANVGEELSPRPLYNSVLPIKKNIIVSISL